MKGINLIAAERRRQINREGYNSAHDDAHNLGELASAAAAYAVASTKGRYEAHALWPWDKREFKPRDAVSNLARAGALIAAEIDRLLRADKTPTKQICATCAWSKVRGPSGKYAWCYKRSRRVSVTEDLCCWEPAL